MNQDLNINKDRSKLKKMFNHNSLDDCIQKNWKKESSYSKRHKSLTNENKKIINQIHGFKSEIKNKYDNRSKSDTINYKNKESIVILDETKS